MGPIIHYPNWIRRDKFHWDHCLFFIIRHISRQTNLVTVDSAADVS